MPAHVTHHRVRFHELDPYDHVNHAMYVTYFEIGRVEALRAVGLALEDLKVEGFQFVVTKLEVRFRKAASAGEDLEIHTGVTEFGRASSGWAQHIMRGKDRIATSQVTAAITDSHGKPTRPPAFIFERLESLRVES
ncbi:MAG: acyl-CoA thioesterase [Acidimicrobiales bacterium]|nr:acyl-CoA thioesterase [Acidimicrobiales bacterium]RZV47906.1 MAG: acyl-CoA thioesterase [Acidimicrobiales bacterium]